MIDRGDVSWWCVCGTLMVRDVEYVPDVKGWRYRCPRPGCNVRLTLDIGTESEANRDG